MKRSSGFMEGFWALSAKLSYAAATFSSRMLEHCRNFARSLLSFLTAVLVHLVDDHSLRFQFGFFFADYGFEHIQQFLS